MGLKNNNSNRNNGFSDRYVENGSIKDDFRLFFF